MIAATAAEFGRSPALDYLGVEDRDVVIQVDAAAWLLLARAGAKRELGRAKLLARLIAVELSGGDADAMLRDGDAEIDDV